MQFILFEALKEYEFAPHEHTALETVQSTPIAEIITTLQEQTRFRNPKYITFQD